MRGLDLATFDFDYDLTWAGLFLDADGRVHGRYGTQSADANSLKGLRHAMEETLRRQRKSTAPASAVPEVRKVEDYPAAKQLPSGACIHCHQVYDFRREALQTSGKWRLDEVWVYPEPRNLGLVMHTQRGNHVREVLGGSAAARLQMRSGDVVRSVNDYPIASTADVQYALHRAGAEGTLPIAWERDGRLLTGKLSLSPGWRKTDIAWRWSLKGLAPQPWVQGEDLTAAEKNALALEPTRLAFRQGGFLSKPARQAGIQINDVIVGVDGKTLHLSARQFEAYVRLNYKVGDEITYNLVRGKTRVDVPLKLVER